MGKLKGKHYAELLEPLEEELVAMARWASVTGPGVAIRRGPRGPTGGS